MPDAISNVEPEIKSAADLSWVVRLTCLTSLVTFGIVWRSYIPGNRIFAMAPVFDFLSDVPVYADWGLFFILVLCLAWLILTPLRRLPAIGALACGIFFIFQDINRLQPYIYMYYFVLFAAVISPREKSVKLDALRIMVSGVYFWAGFHKINMTFFFNILPWFISPIHKFSETGALTQIDIFFVTLMFATPFFEALIGILMLFSKWRPIASLMAFTMLVTVLYCLGPLGHNWEKDVWPWNVWIFLMEMRLFLNPVYNRQSPFLLSWTRKISTAPRLMTASFILFMIAPVAAMFTPWYVYEGFKLYAGNVTTAQILLSKDETLQKAPAFLKKIITDDKNLEFFAIAEHEQIQYFLNPYAIRKSMAGLCPYLDDPKTTSLRIYAPPPFYAFRKQYEDFPLCK